MLSSRSRSLACTLVPVAIWAVWLGGMMAGDRWHLFASGWFMSITMCVGSFIAGATSEGGGAVAFPVMTLVFGIPPSVARDFSLMIQSVGMTSAALFIVLMRVPVEWRAIRYASVGGMVGIVISLDLLAPRLPPDYVKIFFTSLWMSFGGALWWINRHRGRYVATGIADFRLPHALLLMGIGVLGGIVSGLTGSGLDIMTFALLTLFFRVSEKVATPTSVMLMAGNSLVGFFWNGVVRAEISTEAWDYWHVCVPVVVVGAPLGAQFIRKKTRGFIARLLYASIIAQFTAAMLIIPHDISLVVFSIATLTVGMLIFAALGSRGARVLQPVTESRVSI